MKMFFILAVVEWDVFSYILNNAFRTKCQTKFSDYAGNPYSIDIFANVEIWLFRSKAGTLCDSPTDSKFTLSAGENM